ncbi:cadherin domain-containing protein [Chiayiivirga flava]|uniref:Cadherin domain-containing protein n=1 Tax=Chiayiivirga flava TaxID=659595 RepID=A0A7W8D7R5_9GAMM|nr:cadherin domain-containing protein [Chiayiivirga flava]MBB5209464.1 hypothetical protein [Chiayiivirga flava]
MFRRFPARLAVLALVALCAAFAQPAFAQKIFINEFYRAGNLNNTDEWIEVVLTESMTAAQLEGFYVGDSTGTRAAKFSGYRFTNMGAIAANFPAGTVIVVTGSGGPAQDLSYDPGAGDWNLVLPTPGSNITGNGSAGDLAGTDVAYVDTNGTNGDVSMSADGFAVTWTSPASGAFALLADVAIGAPGNNTGAVLASDLAGATTAANWTLSVALASMTPGQPNGGANTTYIDSLRGPAPAAPIVSLAAGPSVAEGNPPTANTLTFEVNVSPAPTAGNPVEFDVSVSGDNTRFSYAGPASIVVTDATPLPVEIEVSTVPNLAADGDSVVTLTLANFTGTDAAQDDPIDTDGTITDDDLAFDAIHTIQGSGQLSPRDGDVVTTRGVVTGVRSNAFYIQTPDADIDADPATSEGLYVYVGVPANMPPGLAVGDLVFVQGTVDEFVPPADPNQLPVTELVAPITVTPIDTAQPLPTPIAIVPDPAGALDQLERFEFMRVSVPDYTVTAPTSASADESFGVVTGTERPFREPGVDAHDCGANLPPEAPANVPCWDTNPELLRLKTNLLTGGAAIPLRSGTQLLNVVGVLDYAFRRYTILTRNAEPFTVVPGTGASGTPAAMPTATELTIGGFNVENLAGPSGTTYERKANKIATTVVDYMHLPDILGFIEVADLATLEDVADRIGALAAANDPDYSAQLLATSGSQRLGFLIKNREVAPGVPRVEVLDIDEYGADLHVICPDGVSETIGLLNDRAPLVMDVVVNAPNGASYPMFVINNHLKSLIGTDSTDDAGAEYACFNDPDNPGGGEGRRNRAKRQQNAEYLTLLVDNLQTANPGKPIVLVGDFNAFQFNDGYADLMNTINGTPTPDDETVVPDDGLDLVDPDLVNLTELVDDEERYSYVFEGNAQVLDHILANQAVIDTTLDFRRETPRVNSDFTTVDATDTGVPFANSDHDPALGFFDVVVFHTADLVVSLDADLADASVGDVVTYEYAVQNNGGDAAIAPVVTLSLPAGTGFVSLVNGPAWSCVTPAVGTSGDVTCQTPSLANGADAEFTVAAELLPAAAGTTVTATATATADSTDPVAPNTASFDTIVEAINVPPAFDPDVYAFTVDAGATPGTEIGGVSATDADGDTLAYAITAGNTGNSFAIDATGTITVADSALLTEGASFTLTVTATDPDGAFDEATVDIDVPAAPAEPIFDPDSYSFEIDEDATNGTVVGQVSATHADGDTLDYAIDAGNTGNVFAIDPATGVITVADASQLVAGSYSLEVSATDDSGDTATAPVEVIVNDVPPAGTAIFADGFED